MSEVTTTLMMPEVLYKALQKRAEQNQNSVETEAVLVIGSVVPYGTDIVPEMTCFLESMHALTDEELRTTAKDSSSQTEQDRIAELNWKASEEGLSDDELAERQRLFEESDRKMLVRGQALALLAQRGQPISALLVLP